RRPVRCRERPKTASSEIRRPPRTWRRGSQPQRRAPAEQERWLADRRLEERSPRDYPAVTDGPAPRTRGARESAVASALRVTRMAGTHAVFLAGERSSSIFRSHFMSVAKACASSGLMKTVSFGPG